MSLKNKILLGISLILLVALFISVVLALAPQLNSNNNILQIAKNYCDASFSSSKNVLFNNTQVQGTLYLNQQGTKPACSSGIEGSLWVTKGSIGVASTTVQVCVHTILDAYTWLGVGLS